MDTVVEENPLSLATSRIVTIRKVSSVKVSTFRSCRPGALLCAVDEPTGLELCARLNFRRRLADTTAKTYATVKRTDHIDHFRFVSDLGRQPGAKPPFGHVWRPL